MISFATQWVFALFGCTMIFVFLLTTDHNYLWMRLVLSATVELSEIFNDSSVPIFLDSAFFDLYFHFFNTSLPKEWLLLTVLIFLYMSQGYSAYFITLNYFCSRPYFPFTRFLEAASQFFLLPVYFYCNYVRGC